MTRLSATLTTALACPICGVALERGTDESIACLHCGSKFPVIDGIAALVPDVGAASSSFYSVEDDVRFGRGSGMNDEYAGPVRDFLRRLSQDALVVEIGSGAGAFDESHPGYVATDYSLVALRKYSSGVRIQADAQSLPFRNQSVDAFFSIATLEHVPDPAKALAELDRCLKPGGKMLLYPAWYVRPWAAKALLVRPYAELRWLDRLRKSTIPVRNGKLYQFARVLPGRLWREFGLRRGRQLPFQWRRLQPNLEEHLISDSDAFGSLDPQAVSTYFLSRGYQDLRRSSPLRRILYGFEPVVVEKPGSGTMARAGMSSSPAPRE